MLTERHLMGNISSVGVGTELKRLLAMAGIHPTPTCNCDARAVIMNEEGPQWCRDNISVIVGWMKEEAKARKMPFIEIAAKLLIKRAIRNAEKKLRILESE